MEQRIGNLNVSRETFERLSIYVELLKKWNPKINLVSRSTLDDIWTRHIVDSAQMFKLSDSKTLRWVDLGSGGGFPGLVLAIISKELAPQTQFTLVESDQRKCAFLRTVARETGVKITVIAQRIEGVDPQNADILSARALSDLPMLLQYAKLHLAKTGHCLFPKGQRWEKEVNIARDSWHFEYEAITSETNAEAVILKVNEIIHV